ncbi:MAG: glycosyltransferase, partial [Patescibacteria group bacterium]
MAQNNPSKRTKVLFLITKATWGGAQRYVYDLATHLPEQEFEPVMAFGQSGKLAKMLSATNIKTHALPSLGRDVAVISDIKSFFEIWRCIRSERPDVVHLNSSKAAALGAIAARLAGVQRIIFTVHGWPFNEKRGEFARVTIFLVSWLTAFLSHVVVVVSKSDEVQGRRMRWIAEKIRYIPIGIEPAAYLSPDEARAALRLESGTAPRIVTIAELTPNKGLRHGIEAISILKSENVDVEYFIVGAGEQRAELEDFAAEMEVEDRVHFLGFIEDAARYLRAFDIFLLPSIKEGMPYVLPEAAAAGLPIITTTVVNPAFVESYLRTKAVSPADPEAL